MPFCPKCRYEYKPTVSVCPDCGSELVDSLPDKAPETSAGEEIDFRKWNQIGRLTSPEYAQMVKEALEQNDIQAVVLSGAGHFGFIGAMGLSNSAPVGGAYSILVPRADAEQADAIAEQLLGEIWVKSRL